jgi:hypothetical protein
MAAKKTRKKAASTASVRGKGSKSAAKAKGKQSATAVRGPVHPRLREQTRTADVVSVPENFHALYDRGAREARGIAPLSATPSQTRGHRRLAAAAPDVDVQYDAVTQLPNFVVTQSPTTPLTRAAAADPATAVAAFLKERGDLWNLTPEDTATVEVVSVSQPQQAPEPAPERGRRRARSSMSATGDAPFSIGNMKTVNLQQRVEGREVFNSDVTAMVNAENQVVAVSGQFFPGAGGTGTRRRAMAATGAEEKTTPAEEAIARALHDLTGVEYQAKEFKPVSSSDSGPYRLYEHRRAKNDKRPEVERPVRVKDVMFPLSAGQFVPGYYMELWVNGYPAFSYVMDAVDTPDILFRQNLSAHVVFKYRVHNTNDPIKRPHDGPAPGTPHPAGKPNGFQAATVPETLISIESLLAGDPWLPNSATTTDGNNCIAYADLAQPNGFGAGDVMGKVSSPGTFDYKYIHTKPASHPTNLQNSLVGMFFHVNWLHDRWYKAGFDEASGNAQKNNFGRGGIGGDPILAEGNDFSGTDNANMSTPADGASPRMQMFEFMGPQPKPSRTSNHEALITFHEMGHYITNRLVGNSTGLSNQQGRAMGEGWGDFFAICMTSQKTDNFASGVFAAGGWTDITATFKENYYFSIRRYPYSANLAKNPLTFKHIGSSVVLPTGPPINPLMRGTPNNEVHNAGEVWCTALWEVFVNLVAKHGHAAAEDRMLAYVIGGLKMTPIRPTFTQARDGIIRTVTLMAPTDLPEVKRGFAKRGMGTGAVSPPSNSTTLAGVVESFVP